MRSATIEPSAAPPVAAAAAAAPVTPSGWIPDVGADVVVVATGMAGKVIGTSGTSVTVQAGIMKLTVNAEDLQMNADAPKPKRPPAKARSLGGTQAARRVDALLGGGGRSNARVPAPATTSYGGGFDFDFDDDEGGFTIGDVVKIVGGVNKGKSGTVVDASGGALSIQVGKNTIKAPFEAVESKDKPSKMKVGTLSNNGGGGKKSKKKKKGGSGLPRATQDPGKPEFNPSSGGGGEEQDDGGINALMNKFRRSS